MDEPDKTNAERIHAIVTGVTPSLTPKLLYGSPAYANADGKPVLLASPILGPGCAGRLTNAFWGIR